MSPTFFDLSLMAMAIAAVSLTISKTYIFKWLRPKKFFGCPYCLSHWLSFLTVYLFIPGYALPGFILLSFALVGLSSIVAIPIAFYLDYIDV